MGSQHCSFAHLEAPWPLPQECRPHCSFAWLVGDEEEALQMYIQQAMKEHPHRGLAGRDIDWSHKVGVLHSIALQEITLKENDPPK